VSFMRKYGKNVLQPERPQMAIKYVTCALLAGYPGLQTQTHNI